MKWTIVSRSSAKKSARIFVVVCFYFPLNKRTISIKKIEWKWNVLNCHFLLLLPWATTWKEHRPNYRRMILMMMVFMHLFFGFYRFWFDFFFAFLCAPAHTSFSVEQKGIGFTKTSEISKSFGNTFIPFLCMSTQEKVVSVVRNDNSNNFNLISINHNVAPKTNQL